VSGILSGVLIAVVAVWFWYMHNRLWRTTVAEQAGGALDAARDLGMVVRPAAYAARWTAAGTIDGEAVEVQWRGGPCGLRSVIRRYGRRRICALVSTEADLSRALAPPSGQGDELPVGAPAGVPRDGVVSEAAENIGESIGDVLPGMDPSDGDAGLGFLEEGLGVEE
jgi:hypothetical protein